MKSVVDAPGMVTTLSSAKRAAVFKDAGLPAEVENDMASYLRTHAAFVVPPMIAAQWTWQRRTELTWRVSSDAISEKSGTDCKGFFQYFCHPAHSDVTEKMKIFG